MANVSKRRRQPKGTPQGGEFAEENKAKGAGDLNEDPFEANGLEDLPDEAKTMARIMAARGGDQVYEDLAKYNEAIGYHPVDDAPREPVATPSDTPTDQTRALALFDGEMKARAFDSLIGKGETDFHGADLHGLDLSNYDLKGLNLDGVNLENAILDHADLSGASMRNAILDGARLTHVKANGIDLTGASARHADLSHMAIHAGRDSHTRLVDADLTGSRLDGLTIDFDDGWDAPGDFDDASGIRLADTVGTGMDVSFTRIENADFANARWDKGRIFVADDEGRTLTGAAFTNMHYFNLAGPYRGVDLTGTTIGNTGTVDYSGAILRNAFFGGYTDLDWRDDISFRDADMRGCVFGPTFRPPEDVTRLSYDLRGARLEGAECWDLKGRTGIRTDRDPEGKKPFDPAAYGMTSRD